MVFDFTFWGVRGSLSFTPEGFSRFGGNTSCMLVRAGPHHIILDAGTGIRALGQQLSSQNINHAHIFFSHTHWDHVMGFPFFAPAFHDHCAFDLYGHLDEKEKRPHIKDIITGQMTKPFFPVPLETMRSKKTFHSFNVRDTINLGEGVVIQTTPLNHQDGCCGYRINYKGRSLCYITDTEHIEGQVDDNILSLIKGADAMIYDCTYTEEEFQDRKGWGHSTWNEGFKLSQMAGVKMMFMFHHDLDRDDLALEAIEREARKQWHNIFSAREGVTVSLVQGK